MKMQGLLGVAALAVASLLPAARSGAASIGTFETGLEGWGPSGFSSKPITVTQSNVVASEGSNSLAVKQTGDGFSWNTKREGNTTTPSDPFYVAWNSIADVPESQVQIEMDVIYHHADIPDNATFMNMSMYLNNPNGFRQVDNLALDDGAHIAGNIDQTIHLIVPLTAFSGFGDKVPANANFYQLGWSMNGNWGAGDATVYYDNIQINVVPEPASAALLALGALPLLRRRRK